MSWKLLWQFLFIVTIVSFIFMFIKFTISGFIDLKKLLKDNERK